MKVSNSVWEWIACQDEHSAALTCADLIALQLEYLLSQQPRASLFLSGGRSPAPVFDLLASTIVDWSRVDVLMVDERFAPSHPEDLNEGMIRRNLLHGHAHNTRFFPLLTAATLDECIENANAATATINTPDIVMLGMGLDGHTASLFPDAPEFSAAMASQSHYVAVHPTAAPHPRISMSGGWLMQTRHLVLFIPGEQKLQAFEHFVAEQKSPSPLPELLCSAESATVIATGG